MLTIGVWITEDYSPRIGGGFSYYDKLIKHIDSYDFNSNLEIVFVSTKPIGGLSKRKLIIGRFGVVETWLYKGLNRMPYSKLRYSLIDRLFRSKTAKLKKGKIDILYYPIQAQQPIPHYPFIATNWDMAHLTTYPFPEFLRHDDFFRRDTWYSKNISQALMVFVESQAGKNEFLDSINFNEIKVKVVPLFAGNAVDMEASNHVGVLQKWGLIKDEYFFYPAQLWAHKNHYNLIRAFKNIEGNFSHLKLVFTGADGGNLEYIKRVVQNFQLSSKVLFLGFVSDGELRTLYSNALALVMPSLLGPTNIPLLEARLLNCPVLCSNLKGHIEMLKDGALYFNPFDVHEIAHCMESVTDLEFRTRLLNKAQLNERESIFKIATALEKLEEYFLELVAIRKTWE